MSFLYPIAGIAIGFLMAVPIGAVGILCIRRTLDGGRRQGYVTGLAGATGDLLFCLVSASGIRLISDFITDHRYEIRLVGGIVLLVMGILLIRSPRKQVLTREHAMEKTGIYFSTLVVTITNPLVMFSYAAVLTMIGVEKLGIGILTAFFAGIFLGSFLWFVFITNVSYRFRTFMPAEKLATVNRVAGFLLVLIGLSAIWYAVGGMG
jgi:threonine/homoserine/homoserine lactone efflux protein